MKRGRLEPLASDEPPNLQISIIMEQLHHPAAALQCEKIDVNAEDDPFQGRIILKKNALISLRWRPLRVANLKLEPGQLVTRGA